MKPSSEKREEEVETHYSSPQPRPSVESWLGAERASLGRTLEVASEI